MGFCSGNVDKLTLFLLSFVAVISHTNVDLSIFIKLEYHFMPKFLDRLPQDSFIIDNGQDGIWVWVGKKATKKEREEALRNAQGFITKKGYPPQ